MLNNWEATGFDFDFQRIAAVIVAAAIVLVLWVFTHYTKIGLGLRGIAQNERAALMLGIDSDRAATLALSLGSALAALISVDGPIVLVEGRREVAF